MDKMLQSSIAIRLLAAIAALWRQSGVRRLFHALHTAWKQSAVHSLCCRALGSQARQTAFSRLRRTAVRLNERLAGWTEPLALLRGSVLYRAYADVMRWGRNSCLFGWLFDGGLTLLILFALAMYLPIDYVLRDVLSIPVLSSLWDEALLLLSVIWVVRTRMTGGQPLAPRTNVMDTPVLLFVCVGLGLMFGVSPFFSVAVAGYRATVQYMLWFFIVTRLMRDDRDFSVVYLTMVAIAVLIALHGIYQYIVAAPIPSNWTDQAEASVRTRVYSVFGSPNIMGDYMVLFAPMCAGLAYYFQDKWAKIFCWIATFCMCFACLFTMSRGAWMAMAVAVLIFAALQDRRLFVLVLIAGIIAMFLPFVASRIGYLFTDDFAASTSNGGRGSRWKIALDYLSTNPIFGFGLGMFGGAVAMQTKVYKWISYFYVDNYYLKIMVEMGYLGFAVFVLLLLCLVFTGCRTIYRSRGDRMYPLAVGIFSGMCGVLVHCYFENIFEEPYMMSYFWILAAMLVYLGFLHRKKHTA